MDIVSGRYDLLWNVHKMRIHDLTVHFQYVAFSHRYSFPTQTNLKQIISMYFFKKNSYRFLFSIMHKQKLWIIHFSSRKQRNNFYDDGRQK